MNTKRTRITMAVTISLLLALPAYARGGFGGGGRSFSGGGRSFSGGGFGGGRSFGGRDFAGGFGGRSVSQAGNFGGGFNSLQGRSGQGFNRQDFAGRAGEGFNRQDFAGRAGQGLNRQDFPGRGGDGFNRQDFPGRGGDGINRQDFPGRGGDGINRQDFPGRGGDGINRQDFANRIDNRPNIPISNRPNFPDHLPTDGGFGNIAGLQNRVPHNINYNDLHNQGQKIRDSFNNNTFNRYNQINNNNNINVNNVNRHAYGYGPYYPYANGWAHGYAHGYWNGANCWGCPGWSQATMWTCMGLSSLTTFLGLGLMGAEIAGSNNKTEVVAAAPAAPSVTNITYEGDKVYIDGQPSGTAAQYYQQAQQLASQAWSQQPVQQQDYPPVAPDPGTGTGSTGTGNTGTSSAVTTEKWAPLGVFSLAEPGQTQSNTLLQLAINQQGTVRGNYLNQLTNERSQIYGSLDKKTQRISWTIGQNNATVFDTRLADLTKDDSQVLVHYGPTNTQTMALIRLPEPAQDPGQDGQTAPTKGSGGASPTG